MIEQKMHTLEWVTRQAVILKALVGLIKKREGIFDGMGDDNGCLDCPLCVLFRDDGCKGCPVEERTAMPGCQNTPYARWAYHHRCAPGHCGDFPTKVHKDCKECADLARAELDFLKSLLPKTNQTEVK